ncbi:MAG: hypothetical protein EZS28_010050 [Streblomastix strix]|uniref:Uncharacterized protein n=1 Tax=Streblomastix strix TaxID=222440 RepID=A0A5J4WI91_9EUKA|nr:MAG: hypothetical protein EZS28_010050 [Streblomastix strix]
MTVPTIAYKLNESTKQDPYPWIAKTMPNQQTKHGKSKKHFTTCNDSSIPHGLEVEKGIIFLTQILDSIELSRLAQQLLINGQRIVIQRHYLYAMRTLAEFSYGQSQHASDYQIYAMNAGINNIASQLVKSHGQSYATQTIWLQTGGAIERIDINTLLGGDEPTDNTRTRGDMIFIDQHDNDVVSRLLDYWSIWNANELEYGRNFDKDLQQQ